MVIVTLSTTAVKEAITKKLSAALDPIYLEVVNESHRHSGPANAETHFHLVVVSHLFSKMNRIGRSRKVHEILREELAGPVHALSQRTFSPEEWQVKMGQDITGSPDCQGGSKIAGKP